LGSTRTRSGEGVVGQNADTFWGVSEGVRPKESKGGGGMGDLLGARTGQSPGPKKTQKKRQ